MTLNRISLMDAYLIETVRSNGISNDELIQKTLNKDQNAWKEILPKLNFERLVEIAEDEELFKSIIEDGYKIKFVTMNGLKNLLKLKFQIDESKYHQIENGLLDLDINEDQLAGIKQFLSDNWQIHEIERNQSTVKVNITVG
ncbi:hypothetical protein [Ureibacillus manganicus]|uniref:Uncharacterized protein n=1 Tax=Ureibacillus manganicus DSM 26584 TaxID=1384049 RepID=A0A0A3IZ23_9BACL|nr:hypothetical protein [Ureibacillus manganicus]KGR80067.1 hypothetical protein CD29_03720 [Ureibacillus manganicus DSM 26584]